MRGIYLANMISKKLLIILVVALPLAFFAGGRSVAPHQISSGVLAAGTKEKFDYLLSNTNTSCGLQGTGLDLLAGESIRGACCGQMDMHRYQEQVQSLKKYSNISQIPNDPYDVPVSLAKELLGYQKDIALNADQQKIYDEATKLSHEGGPCCCRCWRWTAFEGLAKFLITKYNFGAEQIADVWNLEDGCGGEGHEHG